MFQQAYSTAYAYTYVYTMSMAKPTKKIKNNVCKILSANKQRAHMHACMP